MGDEPRKKTAIPSSNTSWDSGCTMLHLRIFHGSGTISFCFPFTPTPVPARTICEYTSRASGPETRITPIPPLPGGVDNAYIVFFSVGDGTTLVKNRLARHKSRTAAFREDSITAGNGTEETRVTGVASVGKDHFSSFRSRDSIPKPFCSVFPLCKLCHGYERVWVFNLTASCISLKEIYRD